MIMLSSCSGQAPNVTVNAPTGVTATAGAQSPGLLGASQTALRGGSLPPSPANRSGSYAGTATPIETGGGLCLETQKVSNFIVRGNSVHFGGFRGTIAPDNGLQMIYGRQWIVGQFEGPTFHGQFDIPGTFGAPECSYMLNLERVAQ
jgi:hypothetical protein